MNISNKLSVFRIFLVPVFLLVLYMQVMYSVGIAIAIFILAAATDMVDGYLARRMNLITDFGKIADPVADKILVVSALIYLVYAQIIPDWMVIIIVAREFAVSGLRIVVASKGVVIAASKIAKFKTISQIIAVIFALAMWPYYWWIMLLAVTITAISGADYLWKGRDLISDSI